MKLLFSFILLIISFWASAQKKIIKGSGCCDVENITPEEAELLALERAKIDASNKLGTYISVDEVLVKAQINDKYTETYRKFSQVFSDSKLVLKNKKTEHSFNNKTQTITVNATFTFDEAEFIDEVRNFFRKREKKELDKVLELHKEYEIKRNRLDKILQSGDYSNLSEIEQLINDRTKIVYEIGKTFYEGSFRNSEIGKRVGWQVARINYFSKRLKEELNRQNQYEHIDLYNIKEKEVDVVSPTDFKIELSFGWKWNSKKQISLLNQINVFKNIELKNINSYQKYMQNNLKRIDKSNPHVSFDISANNFGKFELNRTSYYQRVELSLTNINNREVKKLPITIIPIKSDFSSYAFLTSSNKYNTVLRKNLHRKIKNIIVKQTNLEFYRNRIGLQLITNFSSVTISNNYDDKIIPNQSFQIPFYNTLKTENNINVEFNTFINLNLSKPNRSNNGARFRVGLSVAYIDYINNYNSELISKFDFKTNILTSPIVAFEYGKLRNSSYNGFGLSYKFKSYKTISELTPLNRLSFYNYADEYSFYRIIKSFLIGVSYHDYTVKYNNFTYKLFENKHFSTFSIKLGINIW